MQQRITADQIHSEAWHILIELLNATRSHPCQQQTEPGNRDGVRVNVHATNTIKRPLNQFPHIRSRLFSLPSLKDSRKCPQQEVPRSAGRIDHPKPGCCNRVAAAVEHRRGIKAKLIERRIKRSVENELFDKLGGL